MVLLYGSRILGASPTRSKTFDQSPTSTAKNLSACWCTLLPERTSSARSDRALDELVSHCSVYPDPVHGRNTRTPISRVCIHLGGFDCDLDGGLPHANAHDVRLRASIGEGRGTRAALSIQRARI